MHELLKRLSPRARRDDGRLKIIERLHTILYEILPPLYARADDYKLNGVFTETPIIVYNVDINEIISRHVSLGQLISKAKKKKSPKLESYLNDKKILTHEIENLNKRLNG